MSPFRDVVSILAVMMTFVFANSALPSYTDADSLNWLTRWMQLFGIAMLVNASPVLNGAGACIGVIVALFHWGLMPFGLRDPPSWRSAIGQASMYVIGPALMVCLAFARGGFEEGTGVGWWHLFAFTVLYTAILEYHDFFADEATYEGINNLAFGALGFGILTGTLFALRAASRVDWVKTSVAGAVNDVASNLGFVHTGVV